VDFVLDLKRHFIGLTHAAFTDRKNTQSFDAVMVIFFAIFTLKISH
jgi:hypothetical protein